ncbi:YtxH domain-containing protein [Pueribacillus sp. YX66]|uniref:YtxH domain-containing protein n=1 Tax=Pueribacillus sp. YX66 TaxID=3229242 RepID=UPI00358CF60D
MSKFQQYTAGFLVGSLAGSLIVLFSTPRSGKELRARFTTAKNKLKNTSNQLKSDVSSLKNNIVQLQTESTKALKTVGNDLKDAITNWKEETNPVIQSLKTDIEALKEKAEQTAKELNRR